MDFYNFCAFVSSKKCFTQTWQKWPPHLNNVLTLPSENETSHFIPLLLEYYPLNKAEWQTRWHNPPDWGLVSSVRPHIWCDGLSFSNACMRPEFMISMSCDTAYAARLGAFADWWRSWPMANALACLCSCQWQIFWTYFVTINLFSLYLMNSMFHIMLDAACII